jgi:hypothetical protein
VSPDHFIIEDIYDENWNEHQEEDLRQHWSKKLKVLTDNMEVSELSLWKKAYQIFKKNTPPPALLPEGIEVDVSENDGFENPDDSDDEFNDKNWGQDFCKRFGEVLNVKDSRTNSISYNKF